MNAHLEKSVPTLGNWDLEAWLVRHRSYSGIAQADLEFLLEGHDAAARGRVAPAVVFLKHHKHMKALINAGFSFATVILPNHVTGPHPNKEPEDVRRWALFFNASKQTHAMLDAQGVPKVHEREVNRLLEDYLRDDRLHSLDYFINFHPDQARQWVQDKTIMFLLGQNKWLQQPSPRHNTMLIKLLICGLPAEALRSEVQDKAPQHSAHFERLIAMARTKVLETIPTASKPAKTKALRF